VPRGLLRLLTQKRLLLIYHLRQSAEIECDTPQGRYLSTWVGWKSTPHLDPEIEKKPEPRQVILNIVSIRGKKQSILYLFYNHVEGPLGIP